MSKPETFRGRIRAGAVVGQDFGFFPFHERYPGNQDTEFTFALFRGDRWRGTAKGFGIRDGEVGDYGNGAVYVQEQDIVGEVPQRFIGQHI